MQSSYLPALSLYSRHRCSPVCLRQLAVYVSDGIHPSRIDLHAPVIGIYDLSRYFGRIHCIRNQDHRIAGLENEAAWNHLHRYFQWIYTIIGELKLALLVRHGPSGRFMSQTHTDTVARAVNVCSELKKRSAFCPKIPAS
jgi:hypothetical protein